jgi:heme A synthase
VASEVSGILVERTYGLLWALITTLALVVLLGLLGWASVSVHEFYYLVERRFVQGITSGAADPRSEG